MVYSLSIFIYILFYENGFLAILNLVENTPVEK